MAMGTSDLANLIRRDPEKAVIQAKQIADMATRAQDDLRDVLMQLRSEPNPSQSLLESLNNFVNLWQKRYQVPVNLQLHAKTSLPSVIENVLYRVSQEALNNIARHANAKNVTIMLKQEVSAIYLTLIDNGQGFNTQVETRGLGLLGMRERVRAIGGTLEIDSCDQGTTIEIHIPLANEVTP
jgi:signal transduction histidine kinase